MGSWRTALGTGVAAALAGGLLAGCGGGQRQDADEPSGMFKVDVVRASFPAKQHLSSSATMRVVVRNADTRTIPDIVVTVTSGDAHGGAGFVTRSAQQDLADPTRPLWIVDSEPKGGGTAYVSTWALGPLPAGDTRAFVWHVTPMVAGSHTLRYRVAAGLTGKARAQTRDGEEVAGTFKVTVSARPPQATVNPRTGRVVGER